MLFMHGELRRMLERAQERGDRIAGMLLIDNPAYVTTAQGNYLAFKDEDCQLSYRPANRIDARVRETDLAHYAASGRMVGRPGRIVRKFLTGQALEGLTDVDFERFANNLAALRDDVGNIELVSGTAIRDWYHETKYAPRQGTLANSCMKYGRCQSYFNIYTRNPEVCKMAILTQPTPFMGEQLYGRALVWELSDGRTMLDRVYGTDKTIGAMQQWARERGFIERVGNDARYDARVTVQLRQWRFQSYPYCDTLMYLNQRTGVLSNLHGGHTTTLHGTHGTDFFGIVMRYRIPVIRLYDPALNTCQIAYALVDGASVRGAQRRLTNRLDLYYQNGFEIDMEGGNVRRIVRGMDPFDDRARWGAYRWRKMTELEARYFGMQVGTTLD